MQNWRLIFQSVLLTVLDFIFSWFSWICSIFVFTYLFINYDGMISIVNRFWWVLLIGCVLSFTLTGVYRSLWQHPGIGSMLRLLTSVLIVSFSMYVTLRLHMGYWSNPGLGMLAFYFFLTLSLGIRLLPRIWQTIRQYFGRFQAGPDSDGVQSPLRTLLVGAGESASKFLLHPVDTGTRPRKILGILDNNPRKLGFSLHGVRILGDDSKLGELCKQLDIEEVIIAVPSISNESLHRIVQQVPVRQCRVRIISGLSDGTAPDRLRDLNIGDLLGRPEAVLDMTATEHWVKGKTILVTGGGGSIGSELCRQILQFDPEKLVIFDISENNAHNLKEELILAFGAKGRYRVAIRIGSVQDEQRMDAVWAEFRPSIVFHAAAYKHVPLMEQCPRLALENNVLGTYKAGLCSMRHGVERFVMISTDKAVNPTNVMGASKRLSELLLLSLNSVGKTEFVCVRFGNVLDSNGSVVPLFKRQIEAGGPVTVTHPDIIRYLMTIPEAAKLVLDAGSMAGGGEIFILDMGQPVKILDLAETLIRLAGLTPGSDIQIRFTGLRPGEKLYEELLLDEENLGRTENKKIFVARPTPMTEDVREQFLQQMEETLQTDQDVRTLIRRYVPEYHTEDAEDVSTSNAQSESESEPVLSAL